MESLRGLAEKEGIILSHENWGEQADRMHRLPEFSADCFPEPIAAYCKAVAEAIQCPIDLAACCILGCASSAVVGRIDIRPKHMEDYTEAAQLYLLCSAESGERKTQTMDLIKKPILDWL